MHFPDLSEYRYGLTFSVPNVLNIGSLEGGHSFPTGAKLQRALQNRDAHVRLFLGYHFCTIDDHADGEIEPCHSELWVSGRGMWYSTPALIVHYIRVHQYQPPTEFIDAVESMNEEDPFVPGKDCERLIRGSPNNPFPAR